MYIVLNFVSLLKMSDLNIKELRKKMDITQKQLAEMVGVTTNTVQNWEAGGTIPKSKHQILSLLLSGQHIVMGGQHVQHGDAINGNKTIVSSDIKKMRNELGLSQEALAEKIGVHIRTIQNWESGGTIPKSKVDILQSLMPTPHVVYGGQHVQHGDAINGDKVIEQVREQETTEEKVTVIEKVECDLDEIKAELAKLSKSYAELMAQNTRLLDIIDNLTKNNK